MHFRVYFGVRRGFVFVWGAYDRKTSASNPLSPRSRIARFKPLRSRHA